MASWLCASPRKWSSQWSNIAGCRDRYKSSRQRTRVVEPKERKAGSFFGCEDEFELCAEVSAEQGDVKELQIGVKYKPDSCDIQARKGDRLKVHYRLEDFSHFVPGIQSLTGSGVRHVYFVMAPTVLGTLTDGTVFDSSFERDSPIEFELGKGHVIKGWEQGLLGACVGEKRKLKIPSKLGYGYQGSPPTIPGGATLIFETEVVALNGQTKDEL
ncbi:Peptidyl-prolyl cis-trans isomerase FKBP15-1 [Morella rubra]|uniref:peptidylprolyl isomerase n=1 Tax=Morella rubra TaxID=262757 RepID=A0A6A1WS20_9ROSI|nr:Peptidyl-prolyl cis-trans isomerase FKBP15-1 [Morella rubra]